jgi:beta-glucosidase
MQAQAGHETSHPNPQLFNPALNKRVEDLLAKMTLEEKVGQMSQFTAGGRIVGPQTKVAVELDIPAMIAGGRVGGINVSNRKRANEFQRIAVQQSRLHIPLIFGLDVIHGYNTIYPIPLGLAASFDPTLVTDLSHMSAEEASADNIHMTNSPMVDIARDARWGRIAEGSGESVSLGSAMAKAYVRGYQGKTLSDPTSIVACVKHFAAYGAPTAGRDYSAVDMSDPMLRQFYLPPYKAAIDAGAGTIMAAFNSLNSVPETANPYTLTQILRKEWGFDGFVRSDFNAVAELLANGYALDDTAAAREAVTAGLDMDMASGIYSDHLVALVRKKVVPEEALNQAVRRILRVKFALGLFEHPYADESAPAYEATDAKRALARQAAEESVVLLQNQAQGNQPRLLPIAKQTKTIALIGPLADARAQMLGTWRAKGRPADAVTLRQALANHMRQTGGQLVYAEGTKILTDSDAGFQQAKQAAQNADLVVMALGEDADTMIGEAASRANLNLPGNQEQLLEEIVATGKPVVLVVFSGRPLVLDWASKHVPAIVEAWFPGIEAGPALASILTGETNPSGKSPVSFPRAVGQEPLYLDELPTGRPANKVDLSHPPAERTEKYVSRYIDVPNAPLYPFGHGLSYTTFQYSSVSLNKNATAVSSLMTSPGTGTARPPMQATVTVRNTGEVAGTEVVQLYVGIRGASVLQPERELEGFQRVTLQPGESKDVYFALGFDELSIINTHSERVVEPAEYTVSVGGSSDAAQQSRFQVVP